MALRTNGCCALVVLVVYEQQDRVQHAECSRHIDATLALLFAGQLQPSGACFVLDGRVGLIIDNFGPDHHGQLLDSNSPF